MDNLNSKLDLQNINIEELNKILNKLSPIEKEAAISVLQEYINTGHSSLLDELIMGDYAEVPVDIETFVDSPQYLRAAWYDGEDKCKLYPYWRKELKKIFPDNVTTSVNNTILSGSRGRGKTEISMLIAAYMLYRILCLKNPIQYFHLKSTEKIVFAFMNIKLALAEEIATSKFQNTLQSSPWFLAHGIIEGRTKKMWVPQKYPDSEGNLREVIDIKIGSQADDLIGLPIYFAFFDEVSFQRNQDVEKQKEKAKDMINTAIGGMKTRFVYKGKNPTMLVLASSKRSDKSFLEEHMRKKLKSEGENTYISDGSVWEAKPEGTYSKETFNVALGNKFLQSMVIPDGEDVEPYLRKGYKILPVPIDFKADFLDDIDRALCDFAGISSSAISKYISGAAFDEVVNQDLENPFQQEILTIGDGPDDREVEYYNFFDITKIPKELKNKPLFVHLDMSKTHDRTGIAGVFIKGKKPSTDPNLQSKDLFYTVAFSTSIKAPKGREISFEKNRNFIRWLKRQGFKLKGISSDTFQSADLQQILRAEGYPMEIISVDRVDTDRVCKPYSSFKSAIYERRIEFYPTNLLRREITDLERNLDSGKVDHPDDGCFTGDTKVRLTDGRSLSFFDLVKEYQSGKQNYVYSVNLDKKIIEPKKILKAWKTLENQPLVKLTFDNGESVKCTLTHKFMLRNGEYIEAQDLLPGDSLMPLYVKYPNKGGLTDYRMYYEPFENKWHFEHRKFAKEILDEKHLVHHKDCNKLNNNPDNLIWMSKAEHVKVHSNTGSGAYSKEALLKKSESVKKWHELYKDTDKYKQRAERTRQSILNSNFTKNGNNPTIDWKNHIKDIEQTFNIKWDELTSNEKDSYGVKFARLNDPTIQTRISKAVSENHKKGKYNNAVKALQSNNNKVKELKKLFLEVDKELFFELFGFKYEDLDPHKAAQWVNRYRQKLYDLKNHKLVTIEFLDETADVYDIEVEDNHNFALDAGVFVHNSKDASDAVCGAMYNASKHAEEFAYDYGETAEEILKINTGELIDDRQQLTLDLENELQKMYQERSKQQSLSDDYDASKRSHYDWTKDVIIM